MPNLTDHQKQVLAHIAQRLRRQADQLERLIRSGDSKRLADAYRMVPTETQRRRVCESENDEGA